MRIPALTSEQKTALLCGGVFAVSYTIAVLTNGATSTAQKAAAISFGIFTALAFLSLEHPHRRAQ